MLRRLLRFTLVFASLGLAAFGALSAYFAYQFTGPQRRPVGGIPSTLPAATRDVTFAARDHVELSGWFVPCPGATSAVVLLHGHGSTREQMVARAKLFHDHGYAVLLYDARGHGRSGGALTSVGWYETRDLLGALDFLRAQGFHSFGLLGASQGGATIALAAAQLSEVRWVVLESTYPTLRHALDYRFRRIFHLPVSMAGALLVPLAEWRLGVDIANIAPAQTIARLRCPVLVAAGDHDPSTPVSDTQILFAAAAEPKSLWLVPRTGHRDLYGAGPAAYEQHLLAFVASARASVPSGSRRSQKRRVAAVRPPLTAPRSPPPVCTGSAAASLCR